MFADWRFFCVSWKKVSRILVFHERKYKVVLSIFKFSILVPRVFYYNSSATGRCDFVCHLGRAKHVKYYTIKFKFLNLTKFKWSKFLRNFYFIFCWSIFWRIIGKPAKFVLISCYTLWSMDVHPFYSVRWEPIVILRITKQNIFWCTAGVSLNYKNRPPPPPQSSNALEIMKKKKNKTVGLMDDYGYYFFTPCCSNYHYPEIRGI